MKYVTATVGGIVIFAGSFILLGLCLSAIVPSSWSETDIVLGPFVANVPSLIALVGAGLAATHTFRASLRRAGPSKKEKA